jgi:hypothetical protein
VIDSNTYFWKEGMDDWKKLFQIDELKGIINSTQTEITESLNRTKIQSAYSLNKDSNVGNFYLGADGLWHVYNPISKTWTSQEEVT